MATANIKTHTLDQNSAPELQLSKADALATGVLFALLLTVVQRGVGFGRGILFCRLLTDQQLGQWSLVWSYLMLLAPLAALGLPGCFGKFAEHYRSKGSLGSFTARVFLISTISIGLVCAALFACADTFSYLLFRDPEQESLVQCLAVALFFVSVSGGLIALVESLRQIKTVTWMRFLTGVSFAILGTAIIWIWDCGSKGLTIAFGLCSFIGAIPALWCLYRQRTSFVDSGKRLLTGPMWGRIVPFAIWIIFSDLFHSMFEVTDRYMLIHFSELSAAQSQGLVGQYHSGRIIPLALLSIASLLSGFLLPYLSKAWEDKDPIKLKQLLETSIKFTAVGLTIAGCGVVLIAGPLFDGILQGRYAAGLSVLPMTLVYCIWAGIFLVAQTRLWVAEKGKLVVALVGGGVLANLLLNLLLIPSMNLEGAVLATSIANGLTLLSILITFRIMGYSNDRQIWIACAAPLVLLLSPIWTVIAAVVLCGICVWTPLVFNRQEKNQIVELVLRQKKEL